MSPLKGQNAPLKREVLLVENIERDCAFDDEKFRSGGIRLLYESAFDKMSILKEGVLLETGFDDTQPNTPQTITSWAYDKASESDISIADNRAIDVPCYHPGYTFVEKLQTVSTKFRQQQQGGKLPPNFLRHYYDISQLLAHPEVIAFIGTTEYQSRKEHRFRKDDNLNIAKNEAFLLSDPDTKEQYTRAYQATASLYFTEQIPFDAIMDTTQGQIDYL